MTLCGGSQWTSTDWRKAHCVLGGMCAMSISGNYYLLGNVATYVESYLIVRGEHHANSSWFIPALLASIFCGSLPGLVVGGYLDRVMGPAKTLSIGLGCQIAGCALSTLTVKLASTPSVILSLGVLPGLGLGLSFGSPYSSINKYNFKNLALIYGVVNCGFGGGAIIFNYVISSFINPDNKVPNAARTHGRYFTQVDILDRTPYCFLVLTACYVVLYPVAVSGMRRPPVVEDEMTLQDTLSSDVKRDDTSSDVKCDDTRSAMTNGTGKALNGTYQSITKDNEGKREGEMEGLSPTQLFEYRTFYMLWVVIFLISIVNTIVVGFYKELGQTHIKDDILLATMGTLGGLFSALGRPLWGLFIDKTSFKTGTVVCAAVNCVLMCFWERTLHWSVGLYFVWTVALLMFVSALPVLFVVSCRCYFGAKHYVSNLAVLWAAISIQTVITPFITPVILDNFGWTGFTLLMAIFSFVAMVFSLFLQPEMMMVSVVKELRKQKLAKPTI